MEKTKKNPMRTETLAGEVQHGADSAAELPNRLNRYSVAHHRAIQMANYAKILLDVNIHRKLTNCGDYLVFRDYHTIDQVKLHAAFFCKKHLLCPLCAIRRGAKLVKSYMDRLDVILQEKTRLKAFLVTFTVKDGDDLEERFNHLTNSVKLYNKYRHLNRGHEVSKVEAAVWSYEFKRGKNSGQWHPHMHAVWLSEEIPDAHKLSKEWHAITGDSYIVDVTEFHDQNDVIGGFLEVFKYAVKFSDLPLEDNWHGYQVLNKKRLIASFGLFRGVEIPENLTDTPLEDLPYVQYFYQFYKNIGYSLKP